MDNNQKIVLSQAHPSGDEIRYLIDGYSNFSISFNGENTAFFEEQLEEYLESGVHVAALNSGTSAIHLGLILLNVKAGDEVICQTLTFSASVNPIFYLGATPVFVDSESHTWNICPIALEKAIVDRLEKGKKPKAIIAVHLYGMPFDVEAVLKIAKKYQIPVLEDAAEALGSSYKNQKCGTFGSVGVFSFNGNKIITTAGGGVLIAKKKTIKEKAIFLSTQARDRASHYQHSQIGYNYRMSNLSAGIGLCQLKMLNDYVNLRRKINQEYRFFFRNLPNVKVLTEPSGLYFSNHWLTVIQLESYQKREQLRLFLKKHEIESRPVWKPMHLQPVFKGFPYYGYRIAETLFKKGLCLPSSSNMTLEERNRIIWALKEFFK